MSPVLMIIAIAGVFFALVAAWSAWIGVAVSPRPPARPRAVRVAAVLVSCAFFWAVWTIIGGQVAARNSIRTFREQAVAAERGESPRPRLVERERWFGPLLVGYNGKGPLVFTASGAGTTQDIDYEFGFIDAAGAVTVAPLCLLVGGVVAFVRRRRNARPAPR